MKEDTTKKSDHASPIVDYTAVGRRQRPRRTKYIVAAVAAIIISFGAGLGGGYAAMWLQNDRGISRMATVDGNTIVSQEEEDVSDVAKTVGKSVVSIVTETQTRSYFGTQTQAGAGTGIILTADGYVLTNKHVVSDTKDLSVVTSDGETYDDITLVGSDPLNDLAFIKINNAKDLTPATLGDSSSIRIGQKVVAIGNSLGEFQNTVTSGIVSGMGRPIAAQGGGSVETLTDLLQTDAAINPGNSGGPLTNLSGQVIGINTAVAENAQSIGFAIPINAAKGIIKNLEKTGKFERAYLGVNYVTITPDVAKQYNLTVKSGAYVLSSENQSAVVSGGPAEKAGIKDKDIITKVGDREVGEKGNISSLVSEYAPGEKVKLTVLRDGKTITLEATLEAYKS